MSRTLALVLLAAVLGAAPASAVPVGTSFTYQGELRFNGQPANGEFDFEFALFDVESGGGSLAIETVGNHLVTAGLFTVELQYTDVPFAASQDYWLEVRVREGNSGGGYQQLLPRQKITPSPYSINARGVQAAGVNEAAIADGAVTGGKIAVDAVTSSKILDGAVTGNEIATDAVTSSKILDGAVTGNEIATDAVTSPKILDGAVTGSEIATDAVTSSKILDGAVTGGKIAADAVTSSKIVDGTVAGADVDATQVQRRVTGTCPAGSSIQTVDADGVVTCQAAGVGTVTSVGTAGGLTGGPVMSAGTLSIADDGVTSAKIADNTVASVDIADNTVATTDILDNTVASGDIADGTITTTDVLDNTVASADIADGTITTTDILDNTVGSGDIADGTITTTDILDNTVSTADILNNDITSNDLANNSVASAEIVDGTIVAADVSSASVQLRVTGSCAGGISSVNADGTTACNQAVTQVRPLHTAFGNTLHASANGASSVTIGTDGFPLIAVHHVTNGDLIVIHCENAACTSVTATAIDTAGDVGGFNSIGIDGRGFGVVTYYDATNLDLKLAACTNLACTAATLRTIDSAGDVGKHTSLAFEGANRPAIAYYDETNGNLKFARCTDDLACSTSVFGTADASANNVGLNTNILVFRNVVTMAYHDATTGTLKVATCSFGVCTSGAAAQTADATPTSGAAISMIRAANGFPAIFYTRNGTVFVLRCTNLSCSTFSPGTLVASENAMFLSASTDAIGFPVIAVAIVGAPNDSLAVLRCNDQQCTSAYRGLEINTLNPGFTAQPSIALGHHGFPVVSTRSGTRIVAYTCDNHACGFGSRTR